MRGVLSVFNSFGSAGALHNARVELELTHTRQVKAAVLARRVDTLDAVAARSGVGSSSRSLAGSAAA